MNTLFILLYAGLQTLSQPTLADQSPRLIPLSPASVMVELPQLTERAQLILRDDETTQVIHVRQLHQQAGSQRLTYNLAKLPQGCYRLELQSGARKEVQRICLHDQRLSISAEVKP